MYKHAGRNRGHITFVRVTARVVSAKPVSLVVLPLAVVVIAVVARRALSHPVPLARKQLAYSHHESRRADHESCQVLAGSY